LGETHRFRATVTDSATLLDEPQSTLALGFLERLEMGADPVMHRVAGLREAMDRGLSREEWEEHFRAIAEALVWQHQNAAAAVARVPAMRVTTRQEIYRRLLRGRDFLLSNLEADAPLKKTATAACLSPYHFHRAFTSVFGETPHACLVRNRLGRAARLLQRGGRSVTQVCLDTGFESVPSFTTLFRKQFGVSPGKFRKIR